MRYLLNQGDDPEVYLRDLIERLPILAVFLEFETFRSWAVFHSTIGVLHGHIVVHLDAIPPKRQAG